jgi:predicted nucleotide-binding protein
MALPEPPQGEPRQVLQAIWDHACETGKWPTFAQLDHRWDANHDSDVLDVMRQLPPGFTYGDNFRTEPQGSTVIGLTVAGAHCCHGAGEALSAFIDFIRVATRIQRGWQPPPDDPEAQPVITDQDYARHAGGLLSAEPQYLLLLLLIHSETSLWIGLSGPDSEGHWQATLHRNIRTFRNVTSLDEYWALRHKSWDPPTPDPTGEESRTPTAEGLARDVTREFISGPPGSGPGTDASKVTTYAANRKAIMVIYGHDTEAKDALFDWLRAIGLQPREWNQLVTGTGAASPYIGQVLDHAFQQAQAVIALFTPDERVLSAAAAPNDPRTWRLQARPNVLFEAGMALVSHPTRTVLALLGPQELPSDLGGRHYVRLSPTDPAPLHDLASRLQLAGCETDLSGNDWLKPSRFPDRDHIPPAPTVANSNTPAPASIPTESHSAAPTKPSHRTVAPRPTRLIRTLTGHVSGVWGVAFSPDGTLLATTSNDKTAGLWEVGDYTGRPLRFLIGHEEGVLGVAFSPDGTLLATASNDWTARLWS